MVLAGARCSGGEENLTDCPGVTLGTAGIPCDITDEVYIVCINDMDVGAKQLQCCVPTLKAVGAVAADVKSVERLTRCGQAALLGPGLVVRGWTSLTLGINYIS